MATLSKDEDVRKFKVGDKVTTEFYWQDSDIVRKITKIVKPAETGSGVRIWADDGGTCECCGRPLSAPIGGVDGAWFLPA